MPLKRAIEVVLSPEAMEHLAGYNRWKGNPSVKTITLEKDNPTLVNLVEMAAEGVVVVNRGNKPAYVFMPVEKEDIQSWKLGENPEFLKIMRDSWVKLQKAGGVSLAEARRRLLTDP